MKALIEVEGPSHRIVTAAAMVAILLPRGNDDLRVATAVKELPSFAEWFADMLDEEGGDSTVEELRSALRAVEALRGRLVEALDEAESVPELDRLLSEFGAS